MPPGEQKTFDQQEKSFDQQETEVKIELHKIEIEKRKLAVKENMEQIILHEIQIKRLGGTV